jgi:acetyl-CoA acyltransferase
VRIGLIEGCRTPFVKGGGGLASASVLDLSIHVVRETMVRAGVMEEEVDAVVMGAATPDPSIPYLARQSAIALNLSSANSYSVESACATSARAIANASYELLQDERRVAIAGGAESMSNVPVMASGPLADAVHHRPRNVEMTDLLMSMTLQDLVPQTPGVVEPYTGLALGQHAEEIVSDWGITREASDAFAVQSHHRAAAATADGRLGAEIAPIVVPSLERISVDGLIRPDTSMERVRTLPPVFKVDGTVTAANASPLTDGAAAVLLMSEAEAERRGVRPKVWIRSWAFTSHAPKLGVLLGPSFALPLALDRAGLTLDDLGLIDLHEAFAGQVLANLKAMADDDFARSVLGRDRAIGTVDNDLLNVEGGSVAIGHPFGATGARIALQLANEMSRRGTRYGAMAICAGGTRGAALVLELAD